MRPTFHPEPATARAHPVRLLGCAVLSVLALVSCRPGMQAPAPVVGEGQPAAASQPAPAVFERLQSGQTSISVRPRLLGLPPGPAFRLQYDIRDVSYLAVGLFEKSTDATTIPQLGYFRDDGGALTANNPLSAGAFSALQAALGTAGVGVGAANTADVRRYAFNLVRNPASVPSPVTLANFPAPSAAAPVHAYNLFVAAFDSYGNVIGYNETDLTAGVLAGGSWELVLNLNRGGLGSLSATASVNGSNLDPLEGLSSVVVGAFDAGSSPRLGWIATDAGTAPFDGTQGWFPELQKFIEKEATQSSAVAGERRRYLLREFTSGLATMDVQVGLSSLPPGTEYRAFALAVRGGTLNVGQRLTATASVPASGATSLDVGNLVTGRVVLLAGGSAADPNLVNDTGAAARFNTPRGVALDSAGNLFVADRSNSVVRKVTPAGAATTVAGLGGNPGWSGDGGPATAATVNLPEGVAFDTSGNLYIGDTMNHRVRKVDSAGTITTFAGNGGSGSAGDGGPATAANLTNPMGLAFKGGELYIADYNSNKIRKVDASGNISTVAGNGTATFGGDGGAATSASLYRPKAIAFDAAGNMYIADMYNHRIRKVDGSGIISTVAGNGNQAFSGDGGPATAAAIMYPTDVQVDSSGNLWIADTANNRIRKVQGGTIVSVVATGIPAGLSTRAVHGLAITADGQIYFSEEVDHRIMRAL